ncbi:hypothetical protein ACWTU6_27425 [Mesorhizobium sp. BHbsci]
MARPKLTDGQIERFQMVVPTDEIEAIETWRHENRISSKSEAVRRLCQIGLSFDAEQRPGKQLVRDALDATASGIRALIEQADRADGQLNEDLRRIAGQLMEAMTAQLALYQDMVATDATAAAMQKDGDVDERMREAAELNKRLKGNRK